jgi:exopolysaccharide production protein ExoZ
MYSPPEKRLITIQIGRGLAALLVLLGHSAAYLTSACPFRIFHNNVWSGVVFFFILSGFIILYSKQTYINNPSKLTTYLRERILRIYPIYWVYFIITILVGYLCLHYIGSTFIDASKLNLMDIVKCFFLYPYVVYPYDFTINSTLIGPAWTLSYELLFYASFVFLILNRKVALAVYISWFIGILLVFTRLIDPSMFLIRFILNPEILEFVMGMILAYIVIHFRHKVVRYYKIIFGLGFVMFIAHFNFNGSLIISRLFGNNTILSWGIPFSMIILGAALWEIQSIGFKPGRKIISFGVLLGDASYSIYLTHYFVVMFLYSYFWNSIHISPTYEKASFIMISTITVLLGVMCHLWIEKPLNAKMRLIWIINKDICKTQEKVSPPQIRESKKKKRL